MPMWRQQPDYADIPGEEWRQVPGYRCEASNFGRTRNALGRLYKHKLNREGYFVTSAVKVHKTSSSRNAFVNRLVCAAFHGPEPFPRADARHLDGNPANNRPENLAWGTRKENMADSIRLGRTIRSAKTIAKLTAAARRGENHEWSKLTDAQELEIAKKYWSLPRNRLDRPVSRTVLALSLEYSVSRTTIYRAAISRKSAAIPYVKRSEP